MASLIVSTGPQAGMRVDLGGPLKIGRRPENDLRLRDEQISRFHAKIELCGSEWMIEDLGSRTGTVVNGRLISRTAPLGHGTTILLGQTELRFLSEQGSNQPTLHAPSLLRTEPVTLTDGPPGPPLAKESLTLLPIDESLSLAHLTVADLQRARRAGEHLQTLLLANSLLSTELDLEQLFERILDALFETFPAHRAVLMTADDGGPLLVRAQRVKDQAHPAPAISRTIVQQAFLARAGVHTLDAGADERFDARQSILDQNIRSAICAPMLFADRVLGVIYLDTVGVTHAFQQDDLRLLTGIASAAAGALKNAMLVRRLKDTAADTVFRLAIAAEYRDDDTGFHILRMADYAAEIAKTMGHGTEYCEIMKLASPMHDVGKIGIPDAILKKPGKLTREEFELMKEHTVKGGAILANSDSELLQMAHDIALTHHEKYDGSGYPRGIAGAAIPFEGRVVAMADVFDALLSKRCYKEAYPVEEAVTLLREGAGVQFDPEIVAAFEATLDRLLAIRTHYQTLEAQAKERGEDMTAATLILKKRERSGSRGSTPPPGSGGS